jgi:carbon storage regulator
MLVLTRKVGEQIVIAGEVLINVVAIHGNKVRLSIQAPGDVTIDRSEVHARRLSLAQSHA